MPCLSCTMNLTEEWKFLWPASHTSHTPPLLSHSVASSSLGPLVLRPLPATLTPLISSQSLSPPSLPPLPSLSLSKFLETSADAIPSTSAAISAELPADYLPSPASSFANNRLEPLPYPDGSSTLSFFPTGDNLDRVGFVILSVSDSQLRVKGDVFLSSNRFGHRILQLAAREASGNDDDDCVGFLMASTMYSVHWFRVSLAACGTKYENPVLVYLGNKLFKSSCVAHVSWSPHIPDESLVLLESGQLYFFDSNDHNLCGSTAKFRGKRVPVSWDEHDRLVKYGKWLSCDFSWHPRILVVANSDALFLVDCRFDKCSVVCLMKMGLLGGTDAVESDHFVAFSRAGSDGFYYVVASEVWLVLIDIRVPCEPALLWKHTHQNPRYLSVFSLSTLRGNLGNDGYNQASEMGYGIVLGSFWTGDFDLFCYGPSLSSLKQPVSSKKAIKVSNPFYAWDLPSELPLSGLDCPCSSCLIQEEFAKGDLPEWVNWQHKKQLVIGYIILNKTMSSLLSKADGDDAGFILIRLMSSGKLESQRYNACFDIPQKVKSAHLGSPFDAKDFHLCSSEEEHKFQGKFKYIRLEYLYAYMNDSLTDVLFTKFKNMHEVVGGRSKRPATSSHEFISKKIKTYGLTESTSSFSVYDAVKDNSLPTSVYEATSKRLWTMLPISILGMAFSTYEECFKVQVDSNKVSLDFSAVSDQNQLPPFTLQMPSDRSNKWSKRVKPGDEIVGPVIPLPVSLTLKEISENGRSFIEKVNQFSADLVVKRDSQDVLRVTSELCSCPSNTDADAVDFSVSLLNDSEETWGDISRKKRLHLYKPSAFSDDVCNLPDSARYTTMIANLADDKHELFDDLCPIDLKFEDSSEWNIGSKEIHAYGILKGLFKKQQQKFRPYTDFCEQLKS